jgi:hypothetical protein
VAHGTVRPGTRPAARPVTRRTPAAVGAVVGTQNLAVGPVPMSSVPMSPAPAQGPAPVVPAHLAMGSPNLLAFPVVLPGGGSAVPMNPVPQLALR